ncbi:MAG: CYTH domain-containing protein, partial [Planctomycetota bacterium]
MSYEIEAKIKVDALGPIADKLEELGAMFLHDVQQSELRENDCALRVRRQIIDGESSALITFKGPRANGKFKNRTEHEIGVANAEIGVKIFESLGYHKKIT